MKGHTCINMEAVVFDVGGVLVTSPVDIIREYEKELSLPRNEQLIVNLVYISTCIMFNVDIQLGGRLSSIHLIMHSVDLKGVRCAYQR